MKIFTLLVLLIIAIDGRSQKQIVLLKKQKVLLRLYPGDDFKVRLKGQKRVIDSYVNNIFDGAVLTHRDTIPFAKIDRIYFKRDSRLNIVGGTLLTAGILYFGIDQLNNSVIQKNDASLDEGVTRTSIILVGIGAPLLMIKRKSQRLSHKYRLLTVTKGSAFYRPDPRKDSQFFQN